MRILKATALVAMLAIVPAMAYGQAGTAKKTAPAAKKSAAVASHTTAGTVKSSSDTSLVITKGGKDQTFTLNSATEKTGTIENGAHVTVHYTMDGKNMVATAVTVRPVKPKTPKGKK
ncbi:MAG TPA: hypothetical protein VEL51_09300 [Vicinamibacterales bacterium]|nr:hypothetical protein [Vicinamibacterales bacterium]